MKIIADLHTHSIVSHHAYSTVFENIMAAKKRGLKAIAVTDHAKAIDDGARDSHFKNLGVLNKSYKGVRIFKGAEVNITDFDGHIDLPPKILKDLDFTIASFHDVVIKSKTANDHTNAYINILRNPFIDCIGHSGNPQFPYYHDEVIKLSAKLKKVIEINEGSFYSRPFSSDNCIDILKKCNKYGAYISLNTDSHFNSTVGKFKKSKKMLKLVNFNQELIINNDFEKLKAFIKKRKEEKISFYEKLSKNEV